MVKVKILLVEDECIEAMDIQQILESFGYEVPSIASSGEEAVKKAIEFEPDLILMDIELKGNMNGIEAASKIKKLEIPVIFITAYTDEFIIKKAKGAEPYGFLMKPFNAMGFRLNIETAICKHEYIQGLKEIINGSPIPQFLIDINHTVVYWNRAMTTYTGIKTDEIVGTDQHWKAFYTEKRPCMVDLLADNSMDELPIWYEEKCSESKVDNETYKCKDFFPNIGHDGEWLNFTATIIKNNKGAIIGALETLSI